MTELSLYYAKFSNVKAGLLEFLDGVLGTYVVIENRNGRILLWHDVNLLFIVVPFWA